MNTGSKTKRRSSRRNAAPLYVVFLLFFIVIWFGVKQYQKFKAKQEVYEDLIQVGTLLEMRFRTVGYFADLYSWYTAINYLEKKYFEYENVYIHPDAIPDSIKRRVSMDQIISEIKDFVWSKGINFDEFLNHDEFKAHLRSKFGLRFETVVTSLDSIKYRYEFELNAAKDNYVLKVFEKQDNNFDNDAEDYYIYRSETKNGEIKFINLVNREKYYLFYQQYSDSLAHFRR